MSEYDKIARMVGTEGWTLLYNFLQTRAKAHTDRLTMRFGDLSDVAREQGGLAEINAILAFVKNRLERKGD